MPNITKRFIVHDEIDGPGKYSFTCLICNNTFTAEIKSKKTFPTCKCGNTSKGQYELYTFVKKIYPGAILNFKSKEIHPYEIDIYIPKKRFGIEFNGLYWHSESRGGKRKYAHQHKLDTINKCNIEILNIYDDEWNDNKEIIKSIILSKLGKIKNKIYARKCRIENSLSNEEISKFLNENHLEGDINHYNSIGLYYNNQLVFILSYNKTKIKKKYNIEIVRFCTKINTIVIGALTKLLSYLKNEYTYPIILILNRRYGDKSNFEKFFNLIETTQPNYYYVSKKNYGIKYSNNLNIDRHMLDKVWDCGNHILQLKESFLLRKEK